MREEEYVATDMGGKKSKNGYIRKINTEELQFEEARTKPNVRNININKLEDKPDNTNAKIRQIYVGNGEMDKGEIAKKVPDDVCPFKTIEKDK